MCITAVPPLLPPEYRQPLTRAPPFRAVTGAPGAAYTGRETPLRCATHGPYSAETPTLPRTRRQVSVLRVSAYLLPVIVFHGHYTRYSALRQDGACPCSTPGRQEGGKEYK